MATLEHDIAVYERWLRKQCDVVEADLDEKHERMRRSAFHFLRATYFRWARKIETICPGFRAAPRVLSVGDIHVENFGTWRDAQARLVWGLNDFDEAATMPWPYDLIRLATSARLAPDLPIDRRQAVDAIAAGYRRGLDDPRPMLLDEHGHWLRPLVAGSSRSAQKFWQEVAGYPDAAPPALVRRALKRSLPRDAEVKRHATRSKGGGSLGRPRYLAIARWQGGLLVYEAKALVPSAWHWARKDDSRETQLLDVANGRYRAPDPRLAIRRRYIIRHIAPDAHKIELDDVAGEGLGARLLEAMGADLGAIHAADRRRDRVIEDLNRRDAGWLHTASLHAEQAVRRDFASLTRHTRARS